MSSIFEQAPNLIQTIADYMGVPIGQVRELASEGQITADIVKNAMFAAEDEINEKFAEMPMTWGQLWTSITNQALMTFQPLLQRLNEIANSEQMQTAITGIMNALYGVATVAVNVIDIMAAGGAFIVDNWSVIAPIIGGVAIALGLYTIALKAHNAAQAFSNGLKAAAIFRDKVHAASLAMESGATFTATAIQYGFNAALLACPLTWIVIVIIGVIAALYAYVGYLNKTKGTTISATGIIAGAFAFMGANIINTFVIPVQNKLAMFANFIGNLFNDPVAAVKVLFYDMALTVIGYIESMASAIETVINKIPGVEVDITSGIGDFYNEIEAAQQKVKDESEWKEYVKKWEYLDPEETYNKGYDWGQGVEDKVTDFFGGDDIFDRIQNLASNAAGVFGGDAGSYGVASSMAGDIAGIAGDTSDISDSLDVSEEDLKYLRDIAEQEAINRFTTAEINVDMSGMSNTVHNTNDLDGIVDGLTTRVLEAMEVVKEGV